MSARPLRRSQQAALAGDAAPAAEVRTRKWTRQLRSVGHLTLWKWVPDQEAPTEALQKGAFKKTKGRKRQQPIEVGRMTRSVRQHLDAPLELLNEYPVLRHSSRHSSTTSSPAPHTASAVQAAKKPLEGHSVPPGLPAGPASVQHTATAVTTDGAGLPPTEPAAAATTADPTPSIAPASAPSSMPLIPLPSDVGSSMLSAMVSSDEQLEMALDDLPMLDADEDLFNAPFMSASVPVVPSLPTQPSAPAPEPLSNTNSVSNSASQSGQDDDNNTADDSNASASDDDDGSANSASASPLPSPSPTTSPMPSRSPSP